MPDLAHPLPSPIILLEVLLRQSPLHQPLLCKRPIGRRAPGQPCSAIHSLYSTCGLVQQCALAQRRCFARRRCRYCGNGVGIALPELRTKARNLATQPLELVLFALQKVGGEQKLLGDALGGQKVHVLELIGILRKVGPIDEALVP